jgi:hypothetical protein
MMQFQTLVLTLPLFPRLVLPLFPRLVLVPRLVLPLFPRLVLVPRLVPMVLVLPYFLLLFSRAFE